MICYKNVPIINFIFDVDTIRPICIPVDDPLRSKDFLGYQPFVAGWGKTQEGGNSANVLQELQITVLTNEECKAKYKLINKLVSEQQFDNAVLCAGELIGGKDSCQVGDIDICWLIYRILCL